MSDSSMRVKPCTEEPSNIISPSRAFSNKAIRGHLDVLVQAEDVGELQAQEAIWVDVLIADQVIRSASSVPANLAEGQGRSGRDRQHFWRIAYASAKEVDSHLRLLAHAGVVDKRGIATVLATFDEVRAMTWRLLNPRE
jgi:four helix bundle protein